MCSVLRIYIYFSSPSSILWAEYEAFVGTKDWDLSPHCALSSHIFLLFASLPPHRLWAKESRGCSFGISARKNTHTHSHPTCTLMHGGMLCCVPPGCVRVCVMENGKRVVTPLLNLFHLYLPPDVCCSVSSAPQHLHFPNTQIKIRDLRNKHQDMPCVCVCLALALSRQREAVLRWLKTLACPSVWWGVIKHTRKQPVDCSWSFSSHVLLLRGPHQQAMLSRLAVEQMSVPNAPSLLSIKNPVWIIRSSGLCSHCSVTGKCYCCNNVHNEKLTGPGFHLGYF